MVQNQSSSEKVPAMPLDVCVAETQGSIGYLIEKALRNEFQKRGLSTEIVTVVTHIEVDSHDKAFHNPSKPIGSFFSKEEADKMQKGENPKKMKEEKGKGWRVVVPSPEPIHTLQTPAIEKLVRSGFVVIAEGGGGVPVARNKSGQLEGVEAVVSIIILLFISKIIM